MPATNLCLRFPIRAGGGSDAVAAAAAGGDEAKEDMNAVVEGLREVVKSLRRGREMAEARLELVQQQALRDKSQVQVLQRELTALRHQGNALMSPVPRSPGGAPRAPASPLPGSRILVPVSTPAGISTSSICGLSTRPSP